MDQTKKKKTEFGGWGEGEQREREREEVYTDIRLFKKRGEKIGIAHKGTC